MRKPKDTEAKVLFGMPVGSPSKPGQWQEAGEGSKEPSVGEE